MTIIKIENNRWIVRSTNDGFSAIITNKGTIVDKLGKGVTGVINNGINIKKIGVSIIFLDILFHIYSQF